MLFSSSLVVLAFSAFAAASPSHSNSGDNEVVARAAVPPNTFVAPQTIFSVFQTLNGAIISVTPALAAIPTTAGPAAQAGAVVPLVGQLTTALNTATSQLSALSPGDAGAANEVIAKLVQDILDSLFPALNNIVAKLGLTGLLTPLDSALTGLLTTLNGILPGLLVTVGGILTPVTGGLVGPLLGGLNL